MHRTPTTFKLVATLVAVALASIGAAQTTPATIRLVHAMPGAGVATLYVAGTDVAQASVGSAGDGFVEVGASAPEIVVDVEGIQVAAEAPDLRAGFRYLAVLYRSDVGEPQVVVLPGLVGRMGQFGHLRTVNLVPTLTEVRTFLVEDCTGPYRETAGSFARAVPYGSWEYNHNGPLTVCAGSTPIVPSFARPSDPEAPWLLMNRSLSIYVALGVDGPEVLFIDDTP